MKIDVLINNKEDRCMVEYVLSTWKLVSRSPLEFRVCDGLGDVSAPFVIAYGFNGSPVSDRPCIAILRRHINHGWKYATLEIVNGLLEDPRLKNEVLPAFEGTFNTNLPVMSHTSKSTILNVDLIFNAFAHLACLEERQKQAGGKNITSYASKLRSDRRFLHKPVVNYYFAVLEQCLELIGVSKNDFFPYSKSATVCLTHDVDVVEKNALYIIKQIALQGLRILENPICIFEAGKTFYKRCIKKWPHDGFDALVEIERKNNVRSSFYISGFRANRASGLNSFKEKIIEPRYKISENDKLKNRLIDLIKNDWEVGVHGSLRSHNNPTRLIQEKQNVEVALRTSIKSGRQHWLAFNHSESYKVFNQAGLTIDCTAGFNDNLGFRHGISHVIHPYSNSHEKKDVLSLPLIVMDSTLFDYQCLNAERAFNNTKLLLDETIKFSGTVSILWHTHGFNDNYMWAEIYEKILSYCSDNKIKNQTVESVIR